jgi:hypothetical protein
MCNGRYTPRICDNGDGNYITTPGRTTVVAIKERSHNIGNRDMDELRPVSTFNRFTTSSTFHGDLDTHFPSFSYLHLDETRHRCIFTSRQFANTQILARCHMTLPLALAALDWRKHGSAECSQPFIRAWDHRVSISRAFFDTRPYAAAQRLPSRKVFRHSRNSPGSHFFSGSEFGLELTRTMDFCLCYSLGCGTWPGLPVFKSCGDDFGRKKKIASDRPTERIVTPRNRDLPALLSSPTLPTNATTPHDLSVSETWSLPSDKPPARPE